MKEKLIFMGEEGTPPTMVACVEHVDDGHGLVGGIQHCLLDDLVQNNHVVQ